MHLFLQNLSYRVLSAPGKKLNYQPLSVFKSILSATFCCLTSREIRVYRDVRSLSSGTYCHFSPGLQLIKTSSRVIWKSMYHEQRVTVRMRNNSLDNLFEQSLKIRNVVCKGSKGLASLYRTFQLKCLKRLV